MAERGLLDDVNTVIASLCERVSRELLPEQGRQSDREILVSLAAVPGVIEALSFPREAMRQNKDLTLAKQLLAQGTQSLFKKQHNEALVYINTASRFLPHADQLLCGLYQLRSTVLLHLKKYEECIVDLQKALEKGASDRVQHKLCDKLAGCYVILKKHDKAKETYQRALSVLPHAALPDDKKQNLEQHFREQITLCEKEMAAPTDSVASTSASVGAASCDVTSDEISYRIRAMNREATTPVSSVHPVYPSLRDSCDVIHIDGKGRGVIARRDIKPGEILLTEKCHASVLFMDHWTESCWMCLRRIVSTTPCPGCTSAAFCGDACLREALEGFHGRECGMMGLLHAVAQGNDTVLSLFALRVLTSTPPEVVMNRVKDEQPSQPITNGVATRALDPSDPVSVYEFINSMPQDESLDGVRLGLYSLLLTKYLLPDGETTEKVLRVAALLSNHQRALNITNKAVSYTLIMKGARLFYHSVRIGRALWPTLGLVNHSCDLVADTILMDHRTVVLRAKCSIREGEEVTISYTGHYSREDRETRQTALREGWGFTCGCKACEQDWPQYITSQNPPTEVTITCMNCGQRALKVHSLSKVENKELVCPTCNTLQNPVIGGRKLQEIDFYREKLRCQLLSDLDPTAVYQEVMTSQEVVDHVAEKPNLYQARMSELVHHVFLLMSDRQIVTKLEGEQK